MSDQTLETPDVSPADRDRPLNVAVVRAGGGPEPSELESSAAPPAANPLLKFHQILRGRYLLAVGLGLVLSGFGLLAGYKLDSPEYRSTGLIRVRLSLPRIMFPTEQNSVMPAYEAFVNSQ